MSRKKRWTKTRYRTEESELESELDMWIDRKTHRYNVKSISKMGFHWSPGLGKLWERKKKQNKNHSSPATLVLHLSCRAVGAWQKCGDSYSTRNPSFLAPTWRRMMRWKYRCIVAHREMIVSCSKQTIYSSPNQLMQTSFVSSPPNITAAGEGLSVAVANSVSVPVPTPGWEG
jgi:hypothetical protein